MDFRKQYNREMMNPSFRYLYFINIEEYLLQMNDNFIRALRATLHKRGGNRGRT